MNVIFEHPPVTRPVASRRFVPVYRGLPRPFRLAAWAIVGIGMGVVVGTTFPEAMRLLGSAAALAPGKLAWYAARLTGFLAYLAMAGSVLYGLLLSTRLLDAIVHRPVSLHLHRDLALTGLGLSAVHGAVLLGDATFPFTPAAIVVPFASPYAPVAVGVGQVAFYATVVIAASFRARRLIGESAWRAIHYLTFLAFLGVTAHGIAAGSDTGASWARWVYLGPVTGAVFLASYRLVVALAGRRTGRHVPRVLVLEPARRSGR